MRFYREYALVCVLTLCAVFGLSMLGSGGVNLVLQVLATDTPLDATVVIDPGHGGEDGGAVSCTGKRESEFNLAISLKLEDTMTLLGVRTKMVRREDIAVYSPEAKTLSEKKVSDIKNRVKLVEETPNAVLVSIHQNKFEQAQYSGAQVFFAKTAESEVFAELLQEALRTALDPANHRQIKQSQTVYLMNKITCPGVLIECGFLSNQEEERLLRDEDYQRKLACVIAAGTTCFLRQRGENAG